VSKIGWIFTALAHSTRREILRHLATGEATVGEVRDLFQISHAAVTKHLEILDRAGQISPALKWKAVFPF
jgi:predicted transcriptional regulator